ncbi:MULTISPECIES: ABC transporter permease [unclassified Paenibacillus]|uniref:ABC transporter permease n=1 Tax=unclassified Paenibacillus TaxID=185978 RepID=UPI002F3FB311
MWSIFMTQFAKDRRSPIVVLLFIGLSIILTLLFARSTQGPTSIMIFSEEDNSKQIEEKWAELLNDGRAYYHFKINDAKLARQQVQTGQSQVAVKLMENDYRIIAVSDSSTVQQVEQYVHKVFEQELLIQSLSNDLNETREQVDRYMADPPFRISKQMVDGNVLSQHNMGTQLMFAFTLLVALFVAGFKVNAVTHDKASGIWNRLILSPVSKTSIYLGYLLYSFCMTFFQISVVLIIFRYVLNYDLGNQFSLIIGIIAIFSFSIISLAMLITGFVSKPEQFYAIYPSLIPLIPLVSGAYMMPGTMDNPILTFIADLFPLAYAMDALMQVAIYDAGLNDIALPLAFMLLLGVLYMGVGINLVERKRKS